MERMNIRFITLVAILSLLVPLLAFFPIFSNGFVNWDDADNLLQNFAYRGLGWPQFRWAFTQPHVGEYRPFAWLFFALQYSLWGLQPGPYHVVSFLWHSATTFLLIGSVGRVKAMTRVRWKGW